jgi:hypothetical protein
MDTNSPKVKEKDQSGNSLPTGPTVQYWVRAGGGQMIVIKAN